MQLDNGATNAFMWVLYVHLIAKSVLAFCSKICYNLAWLRMKTEWPLFLGRHCVVVKYNINAVDSVA